MGRRTHILHTLARVTNETVPYNRHPQISSITSINTHFNPNQAHMEPYAYMINLYFIHSVSINYLSHIRHYMGSGVTETNEQH